MKSRIRHYTAILLTLSILIALCGCGNKAPENQAGTDSAKQEVADVKEVVEYADPTITVGSIDAHPGDEVTIPISFMASPGIAACRLIIEYDTENLELKAVTYSDTFKENSEEPAHLVSPLPLTWTQLENWEGNSLFAELTFQVKDEAKIFRNFPVTVQYVPADLIDINETEVEFAVENGAVSTIK